MFGRKFLLLSIITVSLFLVVFVCYFFYNQASHKIVILLADSELTKKKPDNPGGIVIPNSDSLIFEKLGGATSNKRVINILPSPERPAEIDHKKNTNTNSPYSIDDILDNIDTDILATPQNEEENNSDYVMPIDIKSSDKKEDEINGVRVLTSNISRYTKNQKEIQKDSNVFYLQLSSASSMLEVNNQWQQLQKSYPSILQQKELSFEKIESENGRIFFIVLAGSYASQNHAKSACKKLLAKKQNCIIHK